jgi:hexokinase
MAFYIEIIKTDREDKNFAYYVYQFSYPFRETKTTSGKIRYETKEVNGKLKIDKKMVIFI